MTIEGGIGSATVKIAGLHPAYPGILGQARDVAGNVAPSLSSIAGHLQVAVIGANPDDRLIFRRFADRINRGVHFCRRVVDSDAAGLLLLLLLGVVRGQIRRDAIPRLSVVARSKKKLGADVDRPFLVWR